MNRSEGAATNEERGGEVYWLWWVADALAFCGFYVSGADHALYNDATMVVLFRSGTTTVLSIQNNYQGPPEAFAMVVPVPQVLRKQNVRTLPRAVFGQVDTLTAPRLVEYWERDPCGPSPVLTREFLRSIPAGRAQQSAVQTYDLGVRVEARFEVAEYDIVILSARDSSGLEAWLRKENYHIPAGAADALRPYVAAGTNFFVAKVIPEEVVFEEGRAVLSPLRVHYESPDFTLPVRLGLLNSHGQQDLIVHILAGERFEVANYDNAFIPTNRVVPDSARGGFGALYEGFFREVALPGTVVTEYSWDADKCDPCPVAALDPSAIATLGGDVVGRGGVGTVLTRLHYRYEPDGLTEDLVFRAAPPVVGGNGKPATDGGMVAGAAPGLLNRFQGRYVILRRWTGEVACEVPAYGRWDGMPIQSVTSPLTRR